MRVGKKVKAKIIYIYPGCSMRIRLQKIEKKHENTHSGASICSDANYANAAMWFAPWIDSCEHESHGVN